MDGSSGEVHFQKSGYLAHEQKGLAVVLAFSSL
jgi:hypothetical protein